MANTAESKLDAIFFGSIGSVAHCCEIQYNCFNEALKEQGFPAWDKQKYINSLLNSGGKKRVRAWLEESEKVITDEQIQAIYGRKTELFLDRIGKGELVLRPGIKELLLEAKSRGIKTAFVATTPDAVGQAFVDHLGLQDCFDLVIRESMYSELPEGGQMVLKNGDKPKAACYVYAAQKTLNTDKLQNLKIVAFEDTVVSMQGALDAQIPLNIALPNEWSVDQPFTVPIANKIKEVPDLGASADSVIQKLTTMMVV